MNSGQGSKSSPLLVPGFLWEATGSFAKGNIQGGSFVCLFVLIQGSKQKYYLVINFLAVNKLFLKQNCLFSFFSHNLCVCV